MLGQRYDVGPRVGPVCWPDPSLLSSAVCAVPSIPLTENRAKGYHKLDESIRVRHCLGMGVLLGWAFLQPFLRDGSTRQCMLFATTRTVYGLCTCQLTEILAGTATSELMSLKFEDLDSQVFLSSPSFLSCSSLNLISQHLRRRWRCITRVLEEVSCW